MKLGTPGKAGHPGTMKRCQHTLVDLWSKPKRKCKLNRDLSRHEASNTDCENESNDAGSSDDSEDSYSGSMGKPEVVEDINDSQAEDRKSATRWWSLSFKRPPWPC